MARSIFDSVRSFVGLPTAPDPNTESTAEIGSDTSSWWDGYGMDRDDHPDLQGAQRYAQFDAMMFGDPKIREILQAVKLPIRRATWTVTPASQNPVDLAVADFVRWNLGLGDDAGPIALGFHRQLQRSLMCVNYGHMYFERIWGDVTQWQDADGDTHLVRPIRKLGSRWPHTVWRRVPDDDQPAGVSEIFQMGAEFPIPGSKLLTHILDPDGSPVLGTSMLRAAYTFWRMKKGAVTTAAIGFDRFANPLVKVRHPEGIHHAARAAEIGRSIRSHERAYVALPGKPPSPTEEGWDVTFEHASQQSNPETLIKVFDQNIVAAAMASFLEVGTSSRGSSAFATTIAEMFVMSLDAVANGIAEDYERMFIHPLVLENFGVGIAAPTIEVSPIGDFSLETLATILVDMHNAGMNVADIETQNVMREKAKLPVITADQAVQEGTSPSGSSAADNIDGEPTPVPPAPNDGKKPAVATASNPAANPHV